MKKSYNKPTIMVENFMLSECIASCDPSFSNNMSIDNLINDIKIFTGYFNETYGCGNQVPSGEDIEFAGTSLCYHTSSSVVFSS